MDLSLIDVSLSSHFQREIGKGERGEDDDEESDDDTQAGTNILHAVPTSTTQSSPATSSPPSLDHGGGDAHLSQQQPSPPLLKKPTPPPSSAAPQEPCIDNAFTDLFGAPLKAEKIANKSEKKHKSSSKVGFSTLLKKLNNQVSLLNATISVHIVECNNQCSYC